MPTPSASADHRSERGWPKTEKRVGSQEAPPAPDSDKGFRAALRSRILRGPALIGVGVMFAVSSYYPRVGSYPRGGRQTLYTLYLDPIGIGIGVALIVAGIMICWRKEH